MAHELELELLLNYLDDIGLARACQVNTRFYQRVCSAIWLNRITTNFGIGSDLIHQYLRNMTYQQYYLNVNRRINQAESLEELMNNSIQSDRLDLARIAINLGADIYYQNNRPLALASLRGHDNMVVLLLSMDSEVNAKEGRALFLASLNNHPSTVRILLQNGADKGIVQALAVAKKEGHQEVIDILSDIK